MSTFLTNRRCATAWVLSTVLAGCSTPNAITPPPSNHLDYWSGRLGLQIHDPLAQEQSFSASFQLAGSPEQGSLDVFTPLGSQLAKLTWTPDTAQLQQGSKITHSPSLQELVQLSLGTALPVQALFHWLKGQSAEASGWTVDLSRHADGRISAQRTHPLPQASLRVVLDSL